MYMAEESRADYDSNAENKLEDKHKELGNTSIDFYGHLAILVGSPLHTMT
jgi:hypothetical protein